MFDEIHKFNDPANQELYESETQTFEASKGPYTNASQEAFTKSYSRKAKNPWNKITKDVSFPKLGNQGRYSYTSSKITIPAANVTKAGGKKAAIGLIRQYTAVSEYAKLGWNTRLNSPDDPTNQDLMEKQYGCLLYTSPSPRDS